MAENKKEKSNIHRNHRQKVRERYYVNGLNGMPHHNILEMLLFFGIPYKDTNPIAHELIDRFGSLSAVFEAKRTDLMQVKGMTENAACLITMILPLYKAYSQDLFARKPEYDTMKKMAKFLRDLYIDNNNVERIYVVCFDANNTYITHRLLSEGDISSSRLDFRKLAAIVLETNASSVLLSHNHPHGIASPSLQDGEITKKVVYFLNWFKVKLTDHIIISDKDYFSMANSPKFVENFYIFGEK